MAGKIGPALAMGNTVVVKPAPQDPLAIVRLGEVFDEAGFPPGVVNVVVGEGSEAGRGARRVAPRRHGQLHRLDRRRPAHRRGRRPRHEAPAARARRQGRVHRVRRRRPQDRHRRHRVACGRFHSGQICTAPTRVLAQRGIYDQLVAGLERGRRPPQGRRPARARHRASARSSPSVHRDRVEGYVAAGRDEGGTVVAGGERPDLDARLLRGADADRRLHARHEGRAGGDLRPGRRGRALRRRGRGRRPRQRHRVRPLRLRLLERHGPGLRRGPAAAHRQRRHQHRCSATTSRRSAGSR